MTNKSVMAYGLKVTAILLSFPLLSLQANAGPDTVIEVYKGWNYQCQFAEKTAGAAASKVCELNHHVTDNSNQRVLSVAFTVENGAELQSKQMGLRVTVVTPRGADLRVLPALRLSQPGQLPNEWTARYSACIDTGCIADFLLPASDIKMLKASTELEIAFGMLNVQPAVELALPVDGFAEALGALSDAAFR